MIFITLGSQKFQFNRLLKKVDELIENGVINEEVFAQSGASDYIPKNYEYKDYLNRDEFSEYINKSNIVITHAGTGVIIGAVKKGKKVVAVPRMEKYGEHVDDHQQQLIDQFTEMNLICGCKELDNLECALKEVKHSVYHSYDSNTHRIIESLDKYLSES